MRYATVATVVAALLFGIHALSTDKKPVKFRTIAMGELEDNEATKAGFRTRSFPSTHLGFTTFEASDGKKLTIQYGEFHTADEAKRFFDWNLAKSNRIFSQGVKTDSHGSPVGYRAEVLLKPDETKPAVMWTHGATFRIIFATTLADAVELEKQYGE